MKKLLFIIFVFFPNIIIASEISIIELHATKSLDQLVLDQNDDEFNNNEIIENDDPDENTENNNEDNIEIVNDTVTISNFWDLINLEQTLIYFDNINLIKSPILYNEFIKILTDFNYDIDSDEKNKIAYYFIKKLVELGEIQKAYNLVNLIQFSEDDENIIFYKTIKLNYLFSTYQLKEVCDLKKEFNDQKIKLPDYYLEKTDIFCLVMEQKLDEANLLNSLLLEVEVNSDEYFQNLLNILMDYENSDSKLISTLPENYSKNLIFLYSAMLRIAELPLNEKFLEIDPNNLSIPIILSNSTPIELRLKAANQAYLNKLISIESIAALYQSVDFNSDDLNDPIKTIDRLGNNNELIMAYYFQLANIQIFPSSRLEVLIDFWQFAEKVGLEKLSYNLTSNIISSIEPSEDSVGSGVKIATALIYNENYERASKWIVFIENSNLANQDIEKVKLLFDLYQSEDTQKILEYINNNYEKLTKNSNINIKELAYVTLNLLGQENNYKDILIFDKVMDDRKVPTFYITSRIEEFILSKNEFNLFMILLVSIDQKNWTEIHPKHLQLFLKGIQNYKNSELLKPTLINIFENYEIF